MAAQGCTRWKKEGDRNRKMAAAAGTMMPPPPTSFNTFLLATFSLQMLKHILESLAVHLEQTDLSDHHHHMQFIADDITELIRRGWLLDHFDQVLLGLSDAYFQGGKDAALSTASLPSYFAEVVTYADKLRELSEWNRNVYLVELGQLDRRVRSTLQSVRDAQQAVAGSNSMLEVMNLSRLRIHLDDNGDGRNQDKNKNNPL